MSTDAHAATPAADIYSLGQLIGWVSTGNWPRANVPLLPAAGAWRIVVRAATQLEETKRPQDIDAFLSLVASQLDEPPALPIAVAKELLNRVRERDVSPGVLFDLGAKHPDDDEIRLDALPELNDDEVRRAVEEDTSRAREVCRAMGEHVESSWGDRSFKWADSVILFIFRLARAASSIGDLDLLEEASDVLFAWDARWDQWAPQKPIRAWLAAISGDEAAVVAAAPAKTPRFSDSSRRGRRGASRQPQDP